MSFPIYPNNYNSLLPVPHLPEEPNAFSDGIRRVKLLRAAHLECATLTLVWLDIALVTHQIALDYSLTASNASARSNSTADWVADPRPVFQRDHPALEHKGSQALFIAITATSFVFLLEGILRNVYTRVMFRRIHTLNACDAAVCAVSFVLNITLYLTRCYPMIRDILALLIVFRLVRMVTLFCGLTQFEKQQVICMLDGYRREECFNAEHQRMLQTELENRTKECQDLKELVKSATLSRNRLRQKQQLKVTKQQQQQQHQQQTDQQGLNPNRSDAGGIGLGAGCPEDSGHSSDSSPSPDSPPLEIFGRGSSSDVPGGRGGAGGPPAAIELTDIPSFPVDSPVDDEKSITSRM